MKLECECGYVADGDTSQSLVRAAQSHAWDVHQTRLSGPTILAVAGRRQAEGSGPGTHPRSVPSALPLPRAVDAR